MGMSFKAIRNIGLLVLVSIIIVMAGSSLMIMRDINDRLDEVVNKLQPKLEWVAAVSDSFLEAEKIFLVFAREGEGEIKPAIADLGKAIKEAGGLKKKVEGDEVKLVEGFIKSARHFRAAVATYAEEARFDITESTAIEMEKLALRSSKDAYKDLTLMVRNIRAKIKDADAQMIGLARGGQRMITTILTIGILLAVGIALFMSKALADPIQRMMNKAKRIASGDLTAHPEDQEAAHDEIGCLSEALDDVTSNLKDMVAQINEAGLKIASFSSHIIAIDEEQVRGASEQSSSVSEVTTTIEELARSSAQIADSADNVSGVAERTLAGMNEINTRVDRTAKKIIALGEKSQSIGNITQLIDTVAAQTNLLALNAAIEAARAGEAGEGFAVVAQEIRKLAERSGESTEEIRQLITEIQSEINSTIVGIEDSTKWVAEGLKMVRGTAKSAKEISMATQQQKSASKQVVQAMQNIDVVTKQFVSSTREAAASAQRLSNLSQNLKKAIGTFKLDSLK